MSPSSGPADESGFEEFYRHWVPALRRILLWMEEDFSIVEDAIQETMISALKFWPTLRVSPSPRGWLIKVGKQRLSDQREKRHADSLRGEIQDTGGTHSGAFDLVDERLAIVELVRKLQPHQIVPVVLHYYGYKDREIAEIENITPSSVREYRCRGMAALRNLQADGEEARNT